MPKTRFDWIVIIIVVGIVGGGWVYQGRVSLAQANPTGRPPAPQVGHPAPDFTLTTLAGDSLTLSELRGTAVVLNFWATWCGPCRSEMPAFESVWQAQRGNVIFVGVDVREASNAVESFASSLGITYPLPLDSIGEVADIYRVRAFPSTFFIDAEGVVQEVVLGAISRPALVSNLDTILAAQ